MMTPEQILEVAKANKRQIAATWLWAIATMLFLGFLVLAYYHPVIIVIVAIIIAVIGSIWALFEVLDMND